MTRDLELLHKDILWSFFRSDQTKLFNNCIEQVLNSSDPVICHVPTEELGVAVGIITMSLFKICIETEMNESPELVPQPVRIVHDRWAGDAINYYLNRSGRVREVWDCIPFRSVDYRMEQIRGADIHTGILRFAPKEVHHEIIFRHNRSRRRILPLIQCGPGPRS